MYDHIHLGNLRSFVAADILVRTLRHIEKLDVKWVVNITDIDDKMIARSARDYPALKPFDGLAKLADKYTDIFIDDIARVGIERSNISRLPRATDHITQMQKLIRHLIDDGIAYLSNGSIYFSLSSYQKTGHKYGVLSNVHFEPQARVIDDQDQKEGVGDFALWKAAQPGEPSWDFEINGQNFPGRPGWHIECSAMSTKLLGQPFDIHTGGVDLKFPHHENEIAQCGGDLASVFVHNEHLTMKGEKMSKSIGNITKIDGVDDPLAFRLLCLMSHYRKPMDFNDDNLLAAANRLSALRDLTSKNQFAIVAGMTRHDNDKLKKIKHQFVQAMEDDLNTPRALAVLAELETEPLLGGSLEFLAWADAILGLSLRREKKLFSDMELSLQKERDKARKSKDFRRSDELRDQLSELGIETEDLRDATLYWRRD